MHVRSALAGAALLAGTACSQQAAEQAAEATEEAALAKIERPNTEPATPAAVPAGAGATLPPAGAERRYVGRWASRADLCAGAAWVFERDRFGMEDGPMCDFTQVSEIPGGYRIAAECEEPRGRRSASTFTLRFAESARAMLVEDLATLPDTGLVYCGPG